MVVGAAAARARCLLVSGVLPSGVLKEERGGRSCSRVLRSNWPRRQRVLAASLACLASPKKVEKSKQLAHL